MLPDWVAFFVNLTNVWNTFAVTTSQKFLCNWKGYKLVIIANAFYKPHDIKAQDIIEVWEFACRLATKEFEADDLKALSVKELFLELRKEIREVKKTFSWKSFSIWCHPPPRTNIGSII